MDTYDVELEQVAADQFLVTVPALPGLLILGVSLEEVLGRARAAIKFWADDVRGGSSTVHVTIVAHRRLNLGG
ncbi:MAG: type II toxin-antitoxin system HicB family antitoxin [Chloroflexi bacterium]|nr:type II toxin-antitoxin system HicB family antitoxin [Chloroflexota bacterium]